MVHLEHPKIDLERRLSRKELEERARKSAEEITNFLKRLDESEALSRKSKIRVEDYIPAKLYN